MADRKWQAGGNNSIPARALLCLLGILVPFSAACGAPDDFAPASPVGSADPNMVWQVLIGGIAVCAFLTAIALWIHSALRRVKRSQLRRDGFVRSALNNLSQGVVMTDWQKRVVFCNDRYLEIYGLSRSDIAPNMTGPELLAMRRERGTLHIGVDEF
jgi:PAS domain-containing protein